MSFQKGNKLRKGLAPWNKGLKGKQSWHNISGLEPVKKGNQLAKGNPSNKTSFKKGQNRDKNNINWKGNQVKYRALHRWVRRRLGEPTICEMCGKKKDKPKSIHWANKSGKYLRDLSDWISLCAKCHKKYDNTPQK